MYNIFKKIVFICFFVLFSFSQVMANDQENNVIDDYTVLAAGLNVTTEELYAELRHKDFFLRPLKQSDEQSFCDIFSYQDTADNRAYMQYHWDGKPEEINSCKKLFKFRLDRMYLNEKPKGLYFMICNSQDNSIVGHICIGPLIDGEAEVACVILKCFSGKKYSTNALIMLIRFVKKYFPEINTVLATAHPDNIASNHILLNAGFIKNSDIVYKEEIGPRYQYFINLHEKSEI